MGNRQTTLGDLPTLIEQIETQLSDWECDDSLYELSGFARRTEILDQLDALLPDICRSDPGYSSELLSRARKLSSSLEAANTRLFNSIREQIQKGLWPAEFLPLLHEADSTQRGLSYDYLDDLVAGVLQFEPPDREPRPLDPDSVFYQPTPARHIFHLIIAAAITQADTLFDLGSGLGHVPLLASICTGATSVGIELDPAWVASARKCAEALNLRSVSFIEQDARQADISTGTVFYLYTPFTGATLASVLDSLHRQSQLRPIRICTFGPCTVTVAQQSWLVPDTPPDPEQITVFRSRP